MPHLLVDRLRTIPDFVCPCLSYVGASEADGKNRSAYVIDVFDIIGGICFIWGSFDFLPAYSWDPEVLQHGCLLFIVGASIHLCICFYCMSEAMEKVGMWGFETWQNALYVAGCLLFLVGSVLYWPPLSAADPVESKLFLSGAKHDGVGLPVYMNHYHRPFEGTVLFIIGSFLYAFAAFVNGLNLHEFHDFTTQLLTATTSTYMVGSLLFVAGSVAFLPNYGCNANMESLGGYCYIWGSALFTFGGCISLHRTILEASAPSLERMPLGEKLAP